MTFLLWYFWFGLDDDKERAKAGMKSSRKNVVAIRKRCDEEKRKVHTEWVNHKEAIINERLEQLNDDLKKTIDMIKVWIRTRTRFYTYTDSCYLYDFCYS